MDTRVLRPFPPIFKWALLSLIITLGCKESVWAQVPPQSQDPTTSSRPSTRQAPPSQNPGQGGFNPFQLAPVQQVARDTVPENGQSGGLSPLEEALAADSTRPDSVRIDSTLIPWFPDLRTSPVWERPVRTLPKINAVPTQVYQTQTEWLDDGSFQLQTMIGNRRYGVPVVLSAEEYRQDQLLIAEREIWARLQQEARTRTERQKGLLDFSIKIPGGKESAFTTIFGTPEVNLRVNGAASMNIGASIQKSEDPFLPADQQTRVDPTFDQNLQLNIQGRIGDKLTIQTDWDTERAFDFQNRLRIAYQGYDDEIIKQIEMGNVSMQTGNSLIRGGGSLFGVKSIVEMGPLRLTSIVSQQKGDSNVETISGGSQEQVIQIRPADYENDRHFFLDFYTRQQYESSLANPQQLRQTLQIADVNVWVLRENVQAEEGARRAVALVDLGVTRQPSGPWLAPSNDTDRFPTQLIDTFRDPTLSLSAGDLGVDNEADFETGFFSLLQEGIDFDVNKVTGTISLRRALGAREVLGVAFSYIRPDGGLAEVGDVNRGGTDRVFLKMLRPKNVSTENKVFDLTMKNIYSLGASGIQSRENLELSIQFTQGNVAQDRLPGSPKTLLQDLGLDRVDDQGRVSPDNLVDFGTGTLDLANGRVIFPYLEPFGGRVRQVLEAIGTDAEEINRLVYDRLYAERSTLASQDSRNNFYRIDGKAKGGTKDNYNLGFALVEGSVRVTANGVELQEGTDYQVDYTFGNITILNSKYTAAGQEIRIEYENQAFTTIEQKTFTGLRAEYTLTPDIKMGGTVFRYNERPLDDKIRIGDEPIRNTVFGFDANAKFDAPFITRALDAVPLLQTKEPSSITFSGEFAQLRPGVAQTRATARAIENGDLQRDEERGLSFIDDFEGSNIKVSLLNVTRWSLAAAPAAVPGYTPDVNIFDTGSGSGDGGPVNPATNLASRKARADLRSEFSWYTIPRNISNILGNVQFTPESVPVKVTDVFPGKETQNPQEEFITTLDIHVDPTQRGVYSYPDDPKTLYEQQPERTWAGMTTVLPSGQEDFTQNNIEFLEFWVQTILPGGAEAAPGDFDDYEGTIYIDMGIVSEDIVPNSKLNSEDGLAISKNTLIPDDLTDARSVLPATPPAPLGQFSNQDRDIEDVGLDGLPNTGGVNNFNELTIFADFIEQARVVYGDNDPYFLRIQADPSNDDYVYYGESKASGLLLHERFHRMLGRPDGNTPLAQGEKRAVTNRPDTEGLVNASIVEQNNSYFQYEVKLNPADENRLQPGTEGTFIVDRVDSPVQNRRWMLVRIPLTDFTRQYGEINNFQNISYVRFWTSGYKQPFTMRFATFEFVGSQWRKDVTINQTSDPNAEFKIASINIEENGNRTPIPYRQPTGGIRAVNRGAQLQSLANEQSIVLQVENLRGGATQLAKKIYPGGLNLINYSNMRMFVHGEGYQSRQDAEIVLRMGNDLQNNYYEYRQPVTPSNPDYPYQGFDPDEAGRMEEESEQVWIYEENSMNILLSAFNALKQLRDQTEGVALDEVYERSDLLENAVPGATLAIKGNPSLSRVNEVGLGVRNPFDPDEPNSPGGPLLSGQFWLNELRVSGFDNERGWAATMKSGAKLADFATVSGNLTRQTNGFGSLDSRLGQRRTSEQVSYDLSSSVNLDKLLPARQGWRIPVSVSLRSATDTPKFLPDQGDIRFTDYEDAINAREDLSEAEKRQTIQDKVQEVQTVRESFSVNLSGISKTGSKSKLAQATLDNTSLSYVYNTGSQSSPQYVFQDNNDFNTSIQYNLRVKNVKFVTPFWFAEEMPVLKALSGFQLGVMPTSLTTSFSGRRSYSEGKRRIQLGQPESPLQQTHSFTGNTSFNMGYNLTRSITTSFQARGAFDLSPYSIRSAGLTGVDSTAFEIIPTFEVLESLIADSLKARRSTYEESYSASWQPKLTDFKVLSWVNYSTRYSGGFRWENSPLESNLGAKLSNTFRLDHTVRLSVSDLTDDIGFYKKLREADQKETQEREKKKKEEAAQKEKERKEAAKRKEQEKKEAAERRERERAEEEAKRQLEREREEEARREMERKKEEVIVSNDSVTVAQATVEPALDLTAVESVAALALDSTASTVTAAQPVDSAASTTDAAVGVQAMDSVASTVVAAQVESGIGISSEGENAPATDTSLVTSAKEGARKSRFSRDSRESRDSRDSRDPRASRDSTQATPSRIPSRGARGTTDAGQTAQNDPSQNRSSGAGASTAQDTTIEREPRIDIAKEAVWIGRKIALIPFSIKTLNVNYSQGTTGAQAGYSGGSQILQGLMGDKTPGFAYRTGIISVLGADSFIDNPNELTSLQLPSQISTQNNFTMGTSLSPFKNISLDVDWGVRWDDRTSENITLSTANERTSVLSSSGNLSTTVWSFGDGYRTLFETQLQRAFDDISSSSTTITDSTGNGDGRTVLNPTSLENDFRRAYLTGASSSLGSKGFMPIPLPQWKLNWSGLEQSIPVIGRYMSRATLSHAYRGSYRLGWVFNNDEGKTLNQTLGAYQLNYRRGEFDPASVNIEKSFSPLVQLSITWKNAMRTSLSYETSKLVSLALSNTQVTEKNSKGVKFSMGYTIKDFNLPFLSKKLTNNVDVTLNGSFIEDVEQRFQLGTDLGQALQDGPSEIVRDPSQYSIQPLPATGQARINASTVIGYRFSSTVQANAEYGFSKILPRSSRTFERTTHDIRFNVRINIRSS